MSRHAGILIICRSLLNMSSGSKKPSQKPSVPPTRPAQSSPSLVTNSVPGSQRPKPGGSENKK